MENSEQKKCNVQKQSIGSKPFIITLTAIISAFVTFMIIYFLNDGIVLIKNTAYGDLSSVIPVCEVMDNIEKEYYSHDGDVPSKEEMSLTAINAIVDSLQDPYSAYFTAEQYDSYHKAVSSSFKGLGISISVPDNKGALINTVYEDSPAEKAGLQSGDIITSINGTSLEGQDLDFVTEHLKGKDGEEVKLTVLRDKKTVEITAYYGDVIIKTVSAQMLDSDIGYIYISQFADNTDKEFNEKLDFLREKGMKSLIIDVRNNPGGYLNSVTSIADSILSKGTIVSIGNTLNDPKLEVYKASEGGIDVPLVLLINEDSASSSEILAAAIKENGAGTLVGMTTFGKGIVQTTGHLYSTDGYLKLTTSAYYTPQGNDIHKKGVAPDIQVDLDESLKGYIGTELMDKQKDTQLMRAIEWLSNN